MQTATLDDFMAWNDQLVALAEAGVPIDAGLGAAGSDTAEALGRINAVVARRVSRGISVSEALEDDDATVPAAYRTLVQSGLRGGDLTVPLVAAQRLADTTDVSRHAVRSAFFYPLVVCGLAIAGLILFCWVLVPTLENIYAEMFVEPGRGLAVMQVVRDTMPIWSAVLLIGILFWLVWRLVSASERGAAERSATGVWTWLPGARRAIVDERAANLSQTLATLVDRDVPLAEGLRLAGVASGSAELGAAARTLAAALERGETGDELDDAARRFPPFLRWALLDSEGAGGRARALEMAAGIYRQSAARRAERLRIIAPLVVCIVLGGGATLLYSLALFVPLVELLTTVAQPIEM